MSLIRFILALSKIVTLIALSSASAIIAMLLFWPSKTTHIRTKRTKPFIAALVAAS